MPDQTRRLAIRATDEDFANIDAIADSLRRLGAKYPTMTDAVRFALSTTAASITASVATLVT